ncbi:MAG: trimethylamine methyltransferase, partial [Spirochaetes bacterium]
MRGNFQAYEGAEVEVLTADEVKRLLAASFEILERAGAQFHDDESIEILRKGGCSVDGRTVKIPA